MRGGEVFRALSPDALADWEALQAAAFYAPAVQDGRLIASERSSVNPPDGDWAAVLAHPRVPFLSYPYEWTFGMLKDAAALQLELLEQSLSAGLILKDATPYNVQWFGAAPTFIDVGSFERYRGGPWPAYQQFCQLFLYPLLLQAYKGVSFHPWLRGSLDGILPEDFAGLMSARDLLRGGVLKHGWLLSRLKTRFDESAGNVGSELQDAGFGAELILANARSLRKLVSKLTWRTEASEWSDYANANSYDAADREAKERFVREAVKRRPRKLTWDLGCNTGVFSEIASEGSEYVVAMDADHLAVERLYTRLRADQKRRILSLVVNLADASPGLGWRGAERRTLAERGRPDLVLALALVHHLVYSANLPLEDVVRWFAETGEDLVVEFPKREDVMVRRLESRRAGAHPGYDQAAFEAALHSNYSDVEKLELPGGTRTLYCGRGRNRG